MVIYIMLIRLLKYICLIFIFTNNCIAQVGDQISIQKPEQYKNRTLASENSKGKFGFLKKLFSNNFTYYNYYFNANRKFNEAFTEAYANQLDDYSQFISFYPYNLNSSAQNTITLDSVIQKATAGILLHDLRNKWIDDLFLLIGKAYFFKKQYDSAAITFQYINYAFGPRDKDKYRKIIGSNQGGEQNLFNVFGSNEKGNIDPSSHKSHARDEALIWLVRSYIEFNRINEAVAIMHALKNAIRIPKSIEPFLKETEAYLFYKQHQFDSAANCLSSCIKQLYKGNTYARQAFLTAQLYEQAHQLEQATELYKKTIQKTIDPTLEAYARLHILFLNKTNDPSLIQNNLDELLHMVKKEKYIAYRDVLYYIIATIEYNRGKLNETKKWLLESIKFSNNNPIQKDKALVLLGNIAFDEQQYSIAANWYDSISITSLNTTEYKQANQRKPYLSIIRRQQYIIDREDSLQHLASLPTEERTLALKKIVKQLRKQRGLKPEEETTGNTFSSNNTTVDIFNASNSYFANTSLKAQGYGSFVQIWGKRPNVDNWRRRAAIEKILTVNETNDENTNLSSSIDTTLSEITVDALLKNIPLTTTQINASNQRIQQVLKIIAETAINGLEAYSFAIENYLQLIKKSSSADVLATAYFNLIYCYTKINKLDEANKYKKLLVDKFPQSNWAKKLDKDSIKTKIAETNTAYDLIYNQFIEGNFEQALIQKQQFDSLYGKDSYTPQLLFIQSIYYIKTKQDSIAIQQLQSIVQQFSTSPISKRAQNIIAVLKRRKEIEERLNNLQITRIKEEEIEDILDIQEYKNLRYLFSKPDTTKAKIKPVNITKIKPITKTPLQDSLLKAKEDLTTPTNTLYTFNPNHIHWVMIVFDKVASVYLTEARNAFERYHKTQLYNSKFTTQLESLDSSHTVLFIQPFADASNALQYIDKIKPLAPTEIIPWLTNKKYSFWLIDQENWELLKKSKNLDIYKQFLHEKLSKLF